MAAKEERRAGAGPEPHPGGCDRHRDPRPPSRSCTSPPPVFITLFSRYAAGLRPRPAGPPALRADPLAAPSRKRHRGLPVRRDALRAFLRHVPARGKLPRGDPRDHRKIRSRADGHEPLEQGPRSRTASSPRRAGASLPPGGGLRAPENRPIGRRAGCGIVHGGAAPGARLPERRPLRARIHPVPRLLHPRGPGSRSPGGRGKLFPEEHRATVGRSSSTSSG